MSSSFKQFGEIVEEPSKPSSFREFGEIVEKQSEKNPSRLRSILSAPLKGAIKGANELSIDPIKSALGLSGLNKAELRVVDQVLPTEERPLERALERGGRIGVSSVGSPGTLMAKAVPIAVAAALGQLAEESGAPKWAQNIAELSGLAAPRLGKNIVPKEAQKEAVNFLRKQGLSEKEIVPLIRSENFLNRFINQFAAKGGRAEKLARGAKEKFGKSYDFLKESGKEKFLKGNDTVSFDNQLSEVVEKINPRFTRLIEKDLADLRNRGISQKSLIDFYQDINAVVGKQAGGKAVLNLLKKPILHGLEKIDPEAAKQFSGLNNFYGKAQRFSNQIKPNVIDKLLTGNNSWKVIGSLAALKFGFLPTFLKAATAQQLLKEIALNPRLQNLTLQMQQSVARNKFASAMKIFEILQEQLKKSNPELSNELIEQLKDKNNSQGD